MIVTGPSLRVELATQSDAPDLTTILAQWPSERGQSVTDRSVWADQVTRWVNAGAYFTTQIDRNTGFVALLAVRRSGKIVGLLRFQITDGALFVRNLIVLESERGRGIWGELRHLGYFIAFDVFDVETVVFELPHWSPAIAYETDEQGYAHIQTKKRQNGEVGVYAVTSQLYYDTLIHQRHYEPRLEA